MPFLIGRGYSYRLMAACLLGVHLFHLVLLAFVKLWSLVYVVIAVGGLSAALSPLLKVALLGYVDSRRQGCRTWAAGGAGDAHRHFCTR